MNEQIKRRENDLEIADFCWEVLRRWRVLLVGMLVCALGLSGMQLLKDVKASKATPAQVQQAVQKDITEMENALGVQDMDEVLGAAAIAKQLDEKSNYVKTSALMAINPYEEGVVYLQYLVTGVDETVNYAELLSGFAQSAFKASELVEVVAGNSLTYINSEGKFITMSTESTAESSVVIMVRGIDLESALSLATIVESGVSDFASGVSGMQVTLLQETQAVIADEDLAGLQNQVAATIKQLNNNLDSMKSNMTGDQIALYVKYVKYLEDAKREAAGLGVEANNTTAVSDSGNAAPIKVSFSVTKFVIGAVVGLVLAIIYILMAYLFTAKLRTAEEAKKLYQVNILGNVRSGKKGIDLAISKARFHRAGSLTLDEELTLAAANLSVAAEGKKVYMAMSDATVVDTNLLTSFVEKCKKQGVELVVGSEINYHADALTALAEIGTVVFVERIRKSYFDEMYKEISTCLEQGIKVLGMIVIDAK